MVEEHAQTGSCGATREESHGCWAREERECEQLQLVQQLQQPFALRFEESFTIKDTTQGGCKREECGKIKVAAKED